MSKLSLHISDWVNPDFTYDFLERTRPPLVKVFGVAGLDDAKIREAKSRSPGTVFVARMYFPEQGIEKDETTPVDTVFNYDPLADARNAFEQMRPLLDKFGAVIDVWEGYNEIPIDTPAPLTERERQKARNFSTFTVELARLLHGAGQRYAAYSFSTGNPVHIELWDLLVDGLRASDYLALHEYIAPDENWQAFNLTMCNRYRQVYDRLPADARKPLIITECGADYLGQQGFQTRISAPVYLAKMAEYDRELMRDPYVVGATMFCYGIDDKRWKTYDIGGDFTRLLRDYIPAHPTPPLDPAVPIETTHPPATEKPATVPAATIKPQVMPLDQARWWTEEAVRKLEAGAGSVAHSILAQTVVPWFYASAPQHSSDLPNAQAHTAARWYCEEAERRIEASDLQAARSLLVGNVIPWLKSPGPAALGIRGAPRPRGEPAQAPGAPTGKPPRQGARPKPTPKRTGSQTRAKRSPGRKRS